MATEQGVPHREISCEFYWVTCGGPKGACLSEVLQRFLKTHPEVGERNYSTGQDYYRIHEWVCKDGIGSGNLLRLRPQNHAKMAGLTSDTLLDVPLEKGMVLAEYCCFVYVSEFRVLILHRNRDAGSHRRLETYLNEFSAQGPVLFTPIITSDGLDRLARMKNLTTAEFKIADLDNMSLQGWAGTSVGRVLRFAEEAGAITVTVTLSVDRKKKKLNTEPVKDSLFDVVRKLGKSVKSASVRGQLDDDAKSYLLELIEEHLRLRVPVPYAGGYDTRDIHEALREAYKHYRNNIHLLHTTRIRKEQGDGHADQI